MDLDKSDTTAKSKKLELSGHVNVPFKEGLEYNLKPSKIELKPPDKFLLCLSKAGAWGASFHHCLCPGCLFPDWAQGEPLT